MWTMSPVWSMRRPRYDNWQEECVTGIDKAVSAAAGADVIIACIGENSYCETPGNMDDLNLSPEPGRAGAGPCGDRETACADPQ